MMHLRITTPRRYRRNAWTLVEVQNLHLGVKLLLSGVYEP